MKNSIFSFIAFCFALALLFSQNNAQAQFSKPVVVFKGKVLDGKTLEPYSVRVSVREVNNKSVEVTASRSNAASGNYLLVLKPQTNYWLRVGGSGVETKDILIKTPAVADRTVTVEEDIPVKVLYRSHTERQ
jgi:hypothetical protein